MSDTTRHVVDAIDTALADWCVSDDAMRCVPDDDKRAALAPPPYLAAFDFGSVQVYDDDGVPVGSAVVLGPVVLPQLSPEIRALVEAAFLHGGLVVSAAFVADGSAAWNEPNLVRSRRATPATDDAPVILPEHLPRPRGYIDADEWPEALTRPETPVAPLDPGQTLTFLRYDDPPPPEVIGVAVPPLPSHLLRPDDTPHGRPR